MKNAVKAMFHGRISFFRLVGLTIAGVAVLSGVCRAATTEDTSLRALVVQGQAAATLVVSAGAAEQDTIAAQELQQALMEMSGALLPIAHDDQEIGGHRIFIGNTRQAQAAGLTMTQTSSAVAGFRIMTVGPDIFITAESPVAVIYGACELLERLGVRWYLPGPLGTVMPQQNTVRVPDLDVTLRPSFPMRWVGMGEWAYRNKCNGSKLHVNEKDRLAVGFIVAPSIYHGDGRLMPWKDYFPTHPEYFSLVNGKRCEDPLRAKLCVSNPDVVREMAKNICDLLDKNPTIDLIGLSATDYDCYCECSGCTAMDDPGNQPSDRRYSRRQLLFYNAAAREVAKTHPHARILAGAYASHNVPPQDQSLKAEPNLSLIVTHYKYCNMHAIDRENCPPNSHFRDLLDGWRRLIPDIYIYEYYSSPNDRRLQYNLTHAIRRDIPYFHSKGFKGMYTQYGVNQIWASLLNYYVASKLLWDVNTDVDALLEEFYSSFFGKAAVPMKGYFELLSQILEDTDQHMCTAHAVQRDMRLVYHEKTVARLRRFHTEALALAENDLIRARLEKIGLSLEYTERFMDYLKDYYAGAAGDSMSARRALNKLEVLLDDIRTDEKWRQVAHPDDVRDERELEKARQLVKKSALAPQ